MSDKPKQPEARNPYYEGATPEMVGRALLKNQEPEPGPKDENQAEDET